MFAVIDDILTIIAVNFLLMIIWHLLMLFLCKTLSSSFFSPARPLYHVHKWEKNGSFYVSVLKIKKWKDHLPQYISKNGFSKRKLMQVSNITPEYINRFITETCRAEWNHLMCCMYCVVSFCVNSSVYAVIFSFVPIAANLPFLLVQRYNRIRLGKIVLKVANRCATETSVVV